VLLVTAIEGYVDHHNEHPKPFIWTASASDILHFNSEKLADTLNAHIAPKDCFLGPIFPTLNPEISAILCAW
jgi:hypothetical protein